LLNSNIFMNYLKNLGFGQNTISGILKNSSGGIYRKWRYRNGIVYNNNLLSILCHVVYATMGLTVRSYVENTYRNVRNHAIRPFHGREKNR
jgi:hypothetical protein